MPTSPTIRQLEAPAYTLANGTLRCIGCGQIDEDEYHDAELHTAVEADLREIAAETKP